MVSPGRITSSSASPTWISTPTTAPYPNEVRPSTTASRGRVRSLARYAIHAQYRSHAIAASSAVPAMARNGKLPV